MEIKKRLTDAIVLFGGIPPIEALLRDALAEIERLEHLGPPLTQDEVRMVVRDELRRHDR